MMKRADDEEEARSLRDEWIKKWGR